MSIEEISYESNHSDYSHWRSNRIALKYSHSLLDLVFMWQNNPAIKLPFILNKAMELVGLRNDARLFFLALGGSLDFNYEKTAEILLHVAAQYGQYMYSFWYDTIEDLLK